MLLDQRQDEKTLARKVDAARVLLATQTRVDANMLRQRESASFDRILDIVARVKRDDPLLN